MSIAYICYARLPSDKEEGCGAVDALVVGDVAAQAGVRSPAKLPVVATCVAGMTVRTDLLGVTSTIRALGLDQKCYDRLLDSCHSSAIKLAAMTALWA